MGSIWLQTPSGKMIHMPIVGADFNTPDDPVKIPTSILSRNRCSSGTVVISHPTYGSITFDFDTPGRTGSCNQCGECCTHTVARCPSPGTCGYVPYKTTHHICPYLTVLPGGQKGIGKVGGTECSIYATLVDTLKGCTLFPTKVEQIANCPVCGFTFGA